MTIFQRVFTSTPARDCRRIRPCVLGSERCEPGSGGSHGIASARMHFALRGPEAVLTFVVSTNWYLPVTPLSVKDEPSGAYVDFHGGRPWYEGQYRRDPLPDEVCENWEGCYVDAGYSMADEPMKLLIEQGSEAMWTWLENLYESTVASMNELSERPVIGERNRP